MHDGNRSEERTPADPETRTIEVVEVPVWLIVTDRFARCVLDSGDAKDDREGIAEILREECAYGGATAFEIRSVRITVPLLTKQADTSVDGSALAAVEMPADVRAGIDHAIEEARRQGRALAIQDANDVLLRGLPPGRYEVTEAPGSKGIRRID